MTAIYDRLKRMLHAFVSSREAPVPVIAIETRRYSAVVRRILEQYNRNVEISVDGHRYQDADIPELLNSWCTNRSLKKTIDFSLTRRDTPLFGFHDYPFGFFWAAESERSFVQQLAEEELLRIVHPTS